MNKAPQGLISVVSNLHQEDFSAEQNGKFIGQNKLLVQEITLNLMDLALARYPI